MLPPPSRTLWIQRSVILAIELPFLYQLKKIVTMTVTSLHAKSEPEWHELEWSATPEDAKEPPALPPAQTALASSVASSANGPVTANGMPMTPTKMQSYSQELCNRPTVLAA